MKEFVVTAVFTVFFTLVAVSLPSLAQLGADKTIAMVRGQYVFAAASRVTQG